MVDVMEITQFMCGKCQKIYGMMEWAEDCCKESRGVKEWNGSIDEDCCKCLDGIMLDNYDSVKCKNCNTKKINFAKCEEQNGRISE